MEQNVFPAPAVAGELSGMIEARLHTDHGDAEIQARNKALQAELTSSVANPIYVIQNPRTGTTLVGEMRQSWLGAAAFAEFLRAARDKVAAAPAGAGRKVASLEAE